MYTFYYVYHAGDTVRGGGGGGGGGGLFSLRNVKFCTATVQETVFPIGIWVGGGGGGGGDCIRIPYDTGQAVYVTVLPSGGQP